MQSSQRTDKPLPEGWLWVKLGEVCIQDRQLIDPGSDEALNRPYLGLEHIESNTGRILLEVPEIDEAQGKSTTFAFGPKHVLYGKLRPYLNKVALPDFEGRCTTELIPLLPTNLIDRDFFAWLLRREETVNAAMQGKTGSRMPRADMDELLKFLIPLPPLPEQQRIAARLREQMQAVDEARQAAEAQLKAMKQLQAAYLLGVFNQDELPEGWRYEQLGNITEINPRRPRDLERLDDSLTSFVPMTAVDDLKGEIARPETKPFKEIRKGYTYFAEGDVLFAKITPCMQNGKHAIARNLIDGIGFGSTEFHVIRPSNQIYADWIHLFIRQPFILSEAKKHFTGAVGQQRVPDEYLSSIEIPVPPLRKQKIIINKLHEQLTEIDTAFKALRAQLTAINQLPAALLRQAFSGAL